MRIIGEEKRHVSKIKCGLSTPAHHAPALITSGSSVSLTPCTIPTSVSLGLSVPHDLAMDIEVASVSWSLVPRSHTSKPKPYGLSGSRCFCI